MLSLLNKFDFFSIISNHITVAGVIYGAVDIKWRSYHEILIILIDFEPRNEDYRAIGLACSPILIDGFDISKSYYKNLLKIDTFVSISKIINFRYSLYLEIKINKPE